MQRRWLAAALCGCLALFAASFAEAQGPALVEVQEVAQRNLTASLTFVGTVAPSRRATLGSAVAGRLIGIVDDGEWVAKGQPVARMRTGTINIEIQGAKEEQSLRANELVEMKAGLRKEEVRMAQAKAESAKALRDYAEGRYKRVKSLFDQGQATSKEEVEQTLSAYIAADRAAAAAEAEYDLAMEGTRIERIKQAEDRLRMQEETVNLLRDRRNKYWVRSYFNGYVVKQYADVGAWINQGDPLVDVIELDWCDIMVNVPESHIDKVRPGMPAQIRIAAVSPRETWTGEVLSINPEADLRSRTFAVKVRVKNEEVLSENPPVAAALDQTPVVAVSADSPEDSSAAEDQPPAITSTAPNVADDVEPAEVTDTPEDLGIPTAVRKLHRFKSGMLSHVTMRLGERQDAIVVPKDALVLGGSTVDGQPSYTVFVADPAPGGQGYVARAVPVAIGMFEGDMVEVVSRVANDIAPGNLVVTIGNERLRSGAPIRFVRKP
jgi:HlyD family secretion protein